MRHAIVRILPLTLIVLLAFFVLGTRTASACSCLPMSAREQLDAADVVFVGTVTATRTFTQVVAVPGPPSHVELHAVTTFTVERIWKGRPRATMAVFHRIGSPICGYQFTVGSRYHVNSYARVPGAVPPDAAIETGLCSTVPIAGPNIYSADIGPGVPMGRACPGLEARVPAAAIAAALDDPAAYSGWGLPANSSRPPSYHNRYRSWLTLRNRAVPFGPMNGLVWKAQCP